MQSAQRTHGLDIVTNIATATRSILLYPLELRRDITDIDAQA